MPKHLTSAKNHFLAGVVFTIITLIYLNLVTVVRFHVSGGVFVRLHPVDKAYAILQIVKGNSWPFVLVGLAITVFLFIMAHNFRSLKNRASHLYLTLFLVFGLVIQTHQLSQSGLFPQTKSLGYIAGWVGLALVAFAVYYLLSRVAFLVLDRPRSTSKTLLAVVSAALVALLIVVSVPRFSRATTAETEGFNVLLLTVDTLRKDHLSHDGYFRQTSPYLDRFAKEAVVFENAYSTTSYTLPSLASIITGKYPMNHGVRNNEFYALGDTNLTIAEVFKRHGYASGAIMANRTLTPRRNFGQGFDYYGQSYYMDDLKYDIPGLVMLNKISKLFGQRAFLYPGGEARHTTDLAIKFIKNNRSNRFFCWVHYMDPHMPYAPPRGFDNRFCKREKRFEPSNFDVARDLRRYQLNLPPTGETVKRIRALYDGDVLYNDYQIGRLLKCLEELDLTSKTLIVFSADHGESLADHYYYLGHPHLVYNANIAVPLAMRFPDLRYKGVIKDRVSNVNILPTILDFMGFEQVFPGGIDGVSLMPLIGEGRRDYLPAVQSQSGIPWLFDPKLFDEIEKGGVNPLKAVEAKLNVPTKFALEVTLDEWIQLTQRTVIKDNCKLIYVPVMDSSFPSGRRCYYELYDIASDWDEKYDLLSSNPEIFRELKAEMDAWFAADTGSIFADVIEMEEEDIEALRALGYIQ